MRKSAERITFETVRALGLRLPGTEEGTTYGSPALKANGKVFVCMAINKSVEPSTLAVWVPIDERDVLLADAPDIYYVTDHYVEHPVVLVRLARIGRDALEDLLRMAHRFVSTAKPRRGTRRSSRSRRTTRTS